MNLEQLVPRCPRSSHRCIPILTHRKALQTRILKMEDYEECWLHHWKCKVEGIVNHLEHQLHRRNLLQWYRREEQVQSVLKLTEGKVWCQIHLRKREHRSNLGRSLLEGNKDPLLSQARSELIKQEHQVGSVNNCISELQQQACAQRLELQDAQHGFIESRREQVRPQEELSMKEKVLRDTQIRNMHEMGEMKRAQELQVDEVSVPKVKRKPRDNTEARFPVAGDARTDEFYDLFRRISRSGIKSQCLQWFQVLVPCLAVTNACLLTHGIHLDHRKKLLVTNFLRLIHPQGIHSGVSQRERGSVPQATGTDFSFRDDKQNRGTNPMPTFAGRPLTMSSLIPVEFPQNYVFGQQRQQISELQFDNFPNPQSFLVLKIRFKNQVTTCSDFHRKQCYGSKKWRWLIHWTNENPRDRFLKRIFQILRCWTRRLLLLWTRSSRTHN